LTAQDIDEYDGKRTFEIGTDSNLVFTNPSDTTTFEFKCGMNEFNIPQPFSLAPNLG
jgi:hypothetical protein